MRASQNGTFIGLQNDINIRSIEVPNPNAGGATTKAIGTTAPKADESFAMRMASE